MSTLFSSLEQLPADPILGLTRAFLHSDNPRKIDLGVGVYKDDAGNTPILDCIKRAESLLFEQESSKVYTAPEGVDGFNERMTALIFGKQHPTLIEERIATVQTPGGCGALRIAAELIMRSNKKNGQKPRLWLSDPSWANHRPLLGGAGLLLQDYRYFDSKTGSVNFDAMMTSLKQAQAGDIVLLHACCHNPTGADLNREQWQAVAALANQNGFTPFVDMAYQGFADSVDQDAYGIRLLAETLPEVIIATSCSKNFALYRERVGSVSVVAQSPQQADTVKRQLLSIARGLYSMPPAHGAALVDIVLADNILRQEWLEELDAMRQRMQMLRHLLANHLKQYDISQDFSFITRQRGMFSFLGLSVEQVHRLRDEFAIFMTDNSRINIAGINEANVEYLASAIAGVSQ